MTETTPQFAPPDEHRDKPWHWIRVFNGEVWAIRWFDRTGHWVLGNQMISPVRAVDHRWTYIRPPEPPPE